MKDDIPKAVRIGGKGAPRIPPKKRNQSSSLETTLLPFKKDSTPLSVNNCMLFMEPPVAFENPSVRVFSHKRKTPYAYIISGVPNASTECKREVSSPNVSDLKDEVLDDLRDKIDCLDKDGSVEDEVVEIDFQTPDGIAQSDSMRFDRSEISHVDVKDISLDPNSADLERNENLHNTSDENLKNVGVDFHGLEETRANVIGDAKVATRETTIAAAVQDHGFQAQIVDTKQVTLSKGKKGQEAVDVIDANIRHAEGPNFEVNVAEIHTSAKEEVDPKKKK